MKSSFTQLYVHIVFATKERMRLFNANNGDALIGYMNGIIQASKSHLVVGKVMPEHVHLLVNVHPSEAISKLVQVIKANSSRYVNENFKFLGKFSWGEGYAAFSCSESVIPSVKHYIENQEKHHQVNSFADEFRNMLAIAHVAEIDDQDYWLTD